MVVKTLWGGCTFLGFYCIFINKFCENLGERVRFYPPSIPPNPSPCVQLWFQYCFNYKNKLLKNKTFC